MEPGNHISIHAAAPARAAVPSSRVNEWLPILSQAVEEVFDIMLGDVQRPDVQADLPAGENYTAMVGLAGSLRGMVTFCCGSQSAQLIASRMLGHDAECNEEQVCDAVGEICNMVAGNFKNKLIGLDKHCLLSVPAVITGNGYRFHSLAGGESMQTCVALESLPLVVRLDVHD
jgi:chemotaxis protein CheX